MPSVLRAPFIISIFLYSHFWTCHDANDDECSSSSIRQDCDKLAPWVFCVLVRFRREPPGSTETRRPSCERRPPGTLPVTINRYVCQIVYREAHTHICNLLYMYIYNLLYI